MSRTMARHGWFLLLVFLLLQGVPARAGWCASDQGESAGACAAACCCAADGGCACLEAPAEDEGRDPAAPLPPRGGREAISTLRTLDDAQPAPLRVHRPRPMPTVAGAELRAAAVVRPLPLRVRYCAFLI